MLLMIQRHRSSKRLSENNIAFEIREILVYNEPGIEIKYLRSDVDSVSSIILEMSESSGDSASMETNSIFGKIRKFSGVRNVDFVHFDNSVMYVYGSENCSRGIT